jgi:putrescine aminotransferase
VYLYDGEGRKLLDGMSGLWCVAWAMAAASWPSRRAADERAAVLQQLLPVRDAAGHRARAKLAEVTPPQFKHVFFTGSGSESNDTVVRLVRRYWS